MRLIALTLSIFLIGVTPAFAEDYHRNIKEKALQVIMFTPRFLKLSISALTESALLAWRWDWTQGLNQHLLSKEKKNETK